MIRIMWCVLRCRRGRSIPRCLLWRPRPFGCVPGSPNVAGESAEAQAVWLRPCKSERGRRIRRTDLPRHAFAILCDMCSEFEDTLKRLREQGVKETIMVFGSARARDSTQYAAAHAKLQARISGADQDKEKEAAQRELAVRRLAPIY